MVADELKLILRADTAKAVRAMKRAQSQTDNTHTSMQSLVKGLAKTALGWGAAVVSIRGFVSIAKKSVNAFREQEEAEARLRGALLATGENAEIVGGQIAALASELQGVTTYGDEATIKAAGLLQSLADLDSQGLQKVIPAVQDFATGMGMDLTNAAQLVGKTLSSSTNALSRYGIEIDASASKSEKLEQLTAALNEKFGGLSQEMANTASGSLTQMNNALGDLAEEIGGGVLEFFEGAIRGTTEFANAMIGAVQRAKELRIILGQRENQGELSQQEELARLMDKRAELEATIASQTANRITQNEVLAEDARKELAITNSRIAAIQREITYAQAKANIERQLAAGAVTNAEYQERMAALEKERQERTNRLAALYGKYSDEQARNTRLVEQGLISQEEALKRNIEAALEYQTALSDEGVVPGMGAYGGSFQIAAEDVAEFRRQLEALGSTGTNAQIVSWTMALKEFERGLNYVSEAARENTKTFSSWWAENGETVQDINSQINTVYNSVSGLYSTWMGLEDQRSQAVIEHLNRELEGMRARHEAIIAAAQANGRSEEEVAELKQQLLEEEAAKQEQIDKKTRKLEKQQFMREKAAQIAESIMHTASAVVEALPNVPLSVTVGALGAAQTAMIASQSYPGFATGGSFTVGGTGGTDSQLVQFRASPNERVTIETPSQQRAGGSTIVVQMYGDVYGLDEFGVRSVDAINRARDLGRAS